MQAESVNAVHLGSLQSYIYLGMAAQSLCYSIFTSYMFSLTSGENDLNFLFIVSFEMSTPLLFSKSSSKKARDRQTDVQTETEDRTLSWIE